MLLRVPTHNWAAVHSYQDESFGGKKALWRHRGSLIHRKWDKNNTIWQKTLNYLWTVEIVIISCI